MHTRAHDTEHQTQSFKTFMIAFNR